MHTLKQRFVQVALLALLMLSSMLTFSACSTSTSSVQHEIRPMTNLEDDPSRWGIFHDGGDTTGALMQVIHPSIDGTALGVWLSYGEPYAGIMAYRDLPAAHAALSFDLNLSFFFTHEKNVQALEFTMSKWMDNHRWEWALQWENISDDGSQRVPVWRLWTGSTWQSIGLRQSLRANAWHKFHLSGAIVKGQVHYLTFSCDNSSANLSQKAFAPVTSPGDKLSVGMQLDGNSLEAAYSAYLDRVDLLAH